MQTYAQLTFVKNHTKKTEKKVKLMERSIFRWSELTRLLLGIKSRIRETPNLAIARGAASIGRGQDENRHRN